MNQNADGAPCIEPNVSESPHNALLREWQHRVRTMGRDVAHHPKTLRSVMADLDAIGPSEAGDCIQSLVFELQIARSRAQRFADERISISRELAALEAVRT